jgi:hypothetical protein
VFHKPIAGTGVVAESFTTTNNERFNFLTLQGGSFYWGSNTGGAGTDTIKTRVSPSGNSDITLVSGITEILNMIVTPTRVIWVDRLTSTDYRLRMATLTQQTPMTPTEIGSSTAAIGFYADDTHVYWSNGLGAPNGAIRRLAYNDGSASVEPVAVGITTPGAVIVDDTYVYYSWGANIYRVLKAGGAPEAIANVTAQKFLGIDSDHLYIEIGAGPAMDVVRVNK